MKVLVTGSNGMLGKDLCRELEEAGHTVAAADISSDEFFMDITDMASIYSGINSIKPDWVVNCAAYTKVDACETDGTSAMLLNGHAPGLLAKACSESAAKLVHISTDYVFDGTKESPYTEEDKGNPVNVYGHTKLNGERKIQEITDDYIIIRTQWLFGLHGPNFVDTILKLASEKDSLNVVNDQFGSPTYTVDLSKAVRVLIEKNARGVFNVCNRGHASWFELAKKALELAGLSARVNPVPSEAFPRPAKRPANSILSTTKFTEVTGKIMQPWQLALEEYVRIYSQKGTVKFN